MASLLRNSPLSKPPEHVIRDLEDIRNGRVSINLIPQNIEDYDRSPQPIGAGATATVWRGTSKKQEDNKIYAIKVFKITAVEDLRAEAFLLSNLPKHSNIVTFYGGNLRQESDDIEYEGLCLVLEYTMMGSLRSAIKHMPSHSFPLKTLLQYCYQITAGLNHLHNFLWIHRDIKPDNILIRSDGTVALADFGLATMENSREPGYQGTVIYMAPEANSMSGLVWTRKVDIFSLGILMNELLSGQIPFDGYNIVQVGDAIVQGQRPRMELSSIHTSCLEVENLQRLIKMCWAPNPDDRPDTSTLVNELEKMVIGSEWSRSGSAVLITPLDFKTQFQSPPTKRGVRGVLGDKSGLVDVNKILFRVPNPTYSLEDADIICIPRNDKETPEMPTRFIVTPNAEWLVIFCHGNAYDIGGMSSSVLRHYSSSVSANIMMFEYPGYGCSKGKATASKIDNAAIAAYHFAVSVLRWPTSRIIIHGHSIGNGPALTIANTFVNKAETYTSPMIFQSCWTSVKDLARGFSFGANFMLERWKNIIAINAVHGPALFLHGEKDPIAPLAGAEAVMNQCPSLHKKMVRFPQEEHTINGVEVTGAVKSFLANLKPTEKVPPSLTLDIIRSKANDWRQQLAIK